MPRSLQRACLEAGLKLDLNRLMREGCIVPGAYSAFSMRWRNNYWDEEIANADFTAEMTNRYEGRLYHCPIAGAASLVPFSEGPSHD
jgi:hypothetical protein